MISWVLSVVGGALYRCGGYGKPFNTFYRDAGTSLCGAVILFLQTPAFTIEKLGMCFLVWGLGWGSMTTYFKKKGEDAQWFNWVFVGIAFGLTTIPYAITFNMWIPFFQRLALTSILIPAWSLLIGWDDLEESGRGFIYCSTMILF